MARPFTDYVPLQRFQPALSLSPTGAEVAYSSNLSGQYQLWTVPLAGGEPTRLTDAADHAVRAMAWSPDGERLLFMADRDGDEQYQLFEVARTGGEPRRLTSALDRQHVLADAPFTPDGTTVVYAANDRDPAVQDLLLHRLGAGGIRRINSEPGTMLFPASVSPDGRWLSVTAARSNTDTDVGVVDLAAAEPALRILTAHPDEAQHVAGPWRSDSQGLYVRTDAGREFVGLVFLPVTGGPRQPVLQPDWDVEHVVAPPDGRLLAWTVNEAGRSVLHVQREGAPPATVDVPSGEIDALEVAPDGRRAVVLVNTATRPSEIVSVDLGSGALAHLTDSRSGGLVELRPVDPELVAYPTHDGRDIPAWLYRPAGDGPFPVLVSVHGGPEAQERPIYAYAGLYQFLLANGIAVLAPNIRGSTGYGASYQRLIHRDWGGAELGDLDHAAQYLAGLEWVDAERIAVFGGSFGGFAALSCLARLPGRWAAGVSIVGPSNLVTFARSVPPTWRPLMAALVGDPDDDAELLAARSPLTYADDVTAPLFVIQGAKDPRVVKAESDQMVAHLRARGVEVRYDVYDDEGHGFTRRENEIRALGDVGEFLVSHLAGGPGRNG